jgi:hypothetical protein
VASGRWVVEADDAWMIWETRHRPNAEEKGFVVNWLDERERSGPPADAVVDDKGNWTATAGGMEFYYRREDSAGPDVDGYLFVMEIR